MIIKIDERKTDIVATFEAAVNVILNVGLYSEFVGICKSVLPSSKPNPSASNGKFTAKVVAGLGFITYDYTCCVVYDFSENRDVCLVCVSLLDEGTLVNEIDLKWEIVAKQGTDRGLFDLESVRAYGVIKTKDVAMANIFKPAINGYICSIVQCFCDRMEVCSGDCGVM